MYSNAQSPDFKNHSAHFVHIIAVYTSAMHTHRACCRRRRSNGRFILGENALQHAQFLQDLALSLHDEALDEVDVLLGLDVVVAYDVFDA